MKVLVSTLISLFLLAPAASQAQTGAAQAEAQDHPSISIMRSGSQPPNKGPAEYFTGSVQIEPLFSRTIHHAQAAGKLCSSPTPGVHGRRTRSVKP